MIRGFSFLLWTMLPTAAKSGKLVCYEERGAVASRVTRGKLLQNLKATLNSIIGTKWEFPKTGDPNIVP